MEPLTKMRWNVAAHATCFGIALAALFFGLKSEGCKAVAPQKTTIVQKSGLVDLTAAAESSVNSVVYIKVTTNSKTQTVEYSNPFEDFFGDFFGRGDGGKQRRQVQTPKRQASGSGVIISSDGYIVTNNHVVADADEIDVKLNDESEYKGRIIGTDKNTDLALIKIEGKNFPAIPVGDSEKLKLGEWVLAVGNPFSLTSTVTAGIVSAKARTLRANDVESFIQTDAAINQGNSGGALVNANGELVGINAMLYSQTGSYSGYGFAIPTTIMNKVVADLKKYGSVQRAMLGISTIEVSAYIDEMKEKENKTIDLGTTEGIYVADVLPDGSASEGGLEKGDVITHFNGKKISKMGELYEELSTHYPGDKVTVTVIRDKKSITKTLTLRNEQGTTQQLVDVDPNSLGVVLKPVPSDLKQQLALEYGLLVSTVANGKMKEAGVKAGLIIMQVNDQKMETVQDFTDVVKKANMTKERVLWIRAKTQSGRNLSFAVELADEKDNKR